MSNIKIEVQNNTNTPLDIQVGSHILANYGAMFPVTEYTVTEVTDTFVVMQDSDGEEDRVALHAVKEYGTTSPNGSPIGVFLLPATVH